ncbi:NAD-dependent epimerase/dehydratase family protein [Poritiphilus flavus]|uniref:NAD-dependent epimerase/dehydratase family protein n=1 Tax=Poritiphilus flavus TaxID=2697053 RepID=A0A6L9EDK0_9FLAO|nr:NAD-dependent epimerase/dehydratase family protein [Poritiphilus flavus]NAS12711.1 NAD-dependent epimerase/dehydratase family protein [Poritiphilus flavus]
MILVTGGTGLVGTHLILHLLHTNERLRAIRRKSSDLERVKRIFSYYSSNPEELFQKIEWVEAELNDIPSLESAFKGITQVYHCAALISFDPADFQELQKVNQAGTTNIVNLSVSNEVKKLCYVSSIATIGKSLNGVMATEETEWIGEDVNVYALSKHLAELEVWRAAQEGVPVVIVNPGVILGPGFWDSGSGVLFKMGAKGPSFYPPGGTGFVTVTDVVRIMVHLMDSKVTNERFIAVDKNLKYQEILSKIAREFGKRSPKRVLKFWQLEILWRIDYMWSKLSGSGRKLTKKGVQSLRSRQFYDNSKVVKALNFDFELMEGNIYYTCNRYKEEHPQLFS